MCEHKPLLRNNSPQVRSPANISISNILLSFFTVPMPASASTRTFFHPDFMNTEHKAKSSSFCAAFKLFLNMCARQAYYSDNQLTFQSISLTILICLELSLYHDTPTSPFLHNLSIKCLFAFDYNLSHLPFPFTKS